MTKAETRHEKKKGHLGDDELQGRHGDQDRCQQQVERGCCGGVEVDVRGTSHVRLESELRAVQGFPM